MQCTAQPHNSGPSQQQQDESHSTSSTSSRSSTPSVAVQELEQPQAVGTGSFTDFDAAGPMAAQLAGQLVIVSAATSSTGVLIPAQTSPHGDNTGGQPASSMLPEGLPSPSSVEASLTSSVTSFSRCAQLNCAAVSCHLTWVLHDQQGWTLLWPVTRAVLHVPGTPTAECLLRTAQIGLSLLPI